MPFDNSKETYLKNLYSQAEELLSEKQVKPAVKILEELESNCYPEGICLLASVRRAEFGGEPDFESAFMLYSKAFALGYTPAEVGIADCYYYGLGIKRNAERAVEIYSRHFALGNDDAACTLAQAYSNGNGVEKDPKKSVDMLTALAEKGYSKAYFHLGRCYYNGSVLEYSHEKAMEYYTKAIESGHVEGYYGIAWTYYQGKGNEKDHTKAFEYFMLAAEGNYAPAMNSVAYMYTNGEGVDKDYAKALEYTKRSAALMNSRGIYDYGYAYYMGFGVDKDYEIAFKYLKMADEYGCDRAYATLGHAYYHGNGVPKDMAKALEYYTLSAEKGERKNICYFLGCAYAAGTDPAGKKDSKLAYKYLTKAVELGDEKAKQYLESCIKGGMLERIEEEERLDADKKAADNGDPSALAHLAAHYAYEVHQLERRYNEAIDYAKRALSLDPNNAEALTALAFSYKEFVEIGNSEAFEKRNNESVFLYERAMDLGFDKAYELFHTAFFQGGYEDCKYKKDGEWVNVYADETLKKIEFLAIRASDRKRKESVDIYAAEHSVEGDFHIEGGVLKKYLGYSQIVKIPEEITEIGESAFEGCYCVRQVIFPLRLRIIGDRAFYDCRLIKSINLPDTLEKIGNAAFYATNLEQLVCPDGLRSIGESAFEYCTRLSKITVSEGIEEIGQCAFDSTKYIEEISFENPRYIQSASNPKKVLYLAEQFEGDSYSVKSGVEVIAGHVLSECLELKTVTFPKTIVHISPYAFAHWDLTRIKLPDIKKIPHHAFYQCGYLKKVTLSDEIEFIGESAFEECPITSIRLPKNIKTVEKDAFRYTKLKSVELPIGFELPECAVGADMYPGITFSYYDPDALEENTLPAADKSVLPSTGGAISAKPKYIPVSKYPPEFDVQLNREIGYLGKDGFWKHYTGDCLVGYTGSGPNVVIPQGIIDIGYMAFAERSDIKNITFPATLIRIEACAFSNCTGLTEVRIPETVKYIGGKAFYKTGVDKLYVSKKTEHSSDAFKGLGLFKVKKY